MSIRLSAASRLTRLAGACSLSIGCLAPAMADPDDMLHILIEGGTERSPTTYSLDTTTAPASAADSGALLPRVPGANVNRNGPLTGIAQYRGMYGDRLDVRIDGLYTLGACPNGMDPPLSYVPRSLLDNLTVIRGIAPVSAGMETLGGSVQATTRRSRFTSEKTFTPGMEITTGAASVDRSSFVDALGTLANRRHRLHLFGSHESGDDYDYGDGTVEPTRFERDTFGGGYGFRAGSHTFSVDLRRNETGPTGTPALPMDILDTNATLVESEYNGLVAGKRLHARVYWTDDNHRMSNFELRDPPPGMMPSMPPMTRLNRASSNGAGYRLDSGIALGRGRLSFGTDGRLAEHDAVIIDPVYNPAFRVVNFNEVTRDLYGLFAEWNGTVAERWQMQFGVRYNRVVMDAGQVSATMPSAAALQARFNASDRSRNDDNLDLVWHASRALSSEWTLQLEAGRKTRSPSYQARYLWLPLEATNGLADGNVYIGDISLNPETAYEVGLGVDWRAGRAYVEPRVFYRYVDDYIQGVPATDPLALAFNPDTLQYANVDARFYGVDAAWGVTLDESWTLGGVVSYVRGERDDIDDNLYRIAPFNTRATLTWRHGRGWVATEGVWYADQNKVSQTNGETRSDGYALLNLKAGVNLVKAVELTVGLDNVFDRTYADHLSGINRVVGTDVPVGTRLPGHGRNAYVALKLEI